MVDHRVSCDDYPSTGLPGSPAEVDVIAKHWEGWVETVEFVPQFSSHQHARAADGQHIADTVVLTLVGLGLLESGLAPP
jgi:hypothetical protein